MFGLHHRHGRAPGGGMRECGPGRGGFTARFSEGGFDAAFAGRAGGRRRVFDGGELRLLLLALLEEQPRHGYDLIREIEERTGGGYAPSPGVVYPTLTMLDELGHVDEIKEEGARKRFAISEAGRLHLDERREEVQRLLARLGEIGERRSRGNQGPVRRAMAGLMMALREGASDAQRGHAIAAILDEATQRIERL